MKAEDIKKVLIIGGGTMGRQIATQFALYDCEVVVYDIQEEILAQAKKGIQRMAPSVAAHQGIATEKAQSIMEKITFTTRPEEAAQGVQIVSESVPEDPELKGKVFAQFDKLCSPDTIFTTNTSTLIPSMFAEATGRPDKLIALHFHDVRVSTIVDIMPHAGTSEQTIETVKAFAEKTGLNVIMMHKESFGYVFNYILMAFFQQAQTLASKGIATPEDVDRAWMGITKSPLGPFAMMDMVGLDTVWKITEYWAKLKNDKSALKNAEYMKLYVDRGELGQKTRKGFYTYPNPAFAQPDFVAGHSS
jgi:3-hydroxybutyryl-CoA dehydrogenase